MGPCAVKILALEIAQGCECVLVWYTLAVIDYEKTSDAHLMPSMLYARHTSTSVDQNYIESFVGVCINNRAVLFVIFPPMLRMSRRVER